MVRTGIGVEEPSGEESEDAYYDSTNRRHKVISLDCIRPQNHNRLNNMCVSVHNCTCMCVCVEHTGSLLLTML